MFDCQGCDKFERTGWQDFVQDAEIQENFDCIIYLVGVDPETNIKYMPEEKYSFVNKSPYFAIEFPDTGDVIDLGTCSKNRSAAGIKKHCENALLHIQK